MVRRETEPNKQRMRGVAGTPDGKSSLKNERNREALV